MADKLFRVWASKTINFDAYIKAGSANLAYLKAQGDDVKWVQDEWSGEFEIHEANEVDSLPSTITLPAFRAIWAALHSYREDLIPEGMDPKYDDEWNKICEAMALFHEEFNINQEDV